MLYSRLLIVSFWFTAFAAVFLWVLTSYGYRLDEGSVKYLMSAEYFSAIVGTLSRLVLGVIFGVLIGVLLATVGNRSFLPWRPKRTVIVFDVDPLINLLRFIPVIALPALVIFFSGLSEVGKIAIIGFSAFFPVWLIIKGAINNPSDGLLTVGKAAGLSDRAIFRMIFIPSLRDSFVSALRLSVSAGWLSVVASELLGIVEGSMPFGNGLGYQLWRSMELNQIDRVILLVTTFGVFGFASDLLIRSFLQRERKVVGD